MWIALLQNHAMGPTLGCGPSQEDAKMALVRGYCAAIKGSGGAWHDPAGAMKGSLLEAFDRLHDYHGVRVQEVQMLACYDLDYGRRIV